MSRRTQKHNRHGFRDSDWRDVPGYGWLPPAELVVRVVVRCRLCSNLLATLVSSTIPDYPHDLAIQNPHGGTWQIDVEPGTATAQRLVLECTACQRREMWLAVTSVQSVVDGLWTADGHAETILFV